MERIVGGIFIEAAMPSSCSHSCRQFLTIIHAFAHTESEKHSPPSVAKISARYRIELDAVAIPISASLLYGLGDGRQIWHRGSHSRAGWLQLRSFRVGVYRRP